MTELNKSALGRLAFWSLNMTSIADARMSWPGFSYTEQEMARMRELSQAVEPAAYSRFILLTAVTFIAIAAVAICAIFLPLATVLFPIPAETKPLPFVLLLGGTALLALGIGLPLAMRMASAWSGGEAIGAGIAPVAGDAELSAKVSRQIFRMTAIMCGIFVPGTLLWIAYDIHGGPLITALKWVAIGLMAVSTTHAIVSRRKS